MFPLERDPPLAGRLACERERERLRLAALAKYHQCNGQPSSGASLDDERVMKMKPIASARLVVLRNWRDSKEKLARKPQEMRNEKQRTKSSSISHPALNAVVSFTVTRFERTFFRRRDISLLSRLLIPRRLEDCATKEMESYLSGPIWRFSLRVLQNSQPQRDILSGPESCEMAHSCE